jgi:tetratricopeptide (TPR) repeat protein
LARIGTHATPDLWTLLRLGPADIDSLASEAIVVNSDDNMAVELESPWRLWDDAVVSMNEELIRRYLGGVLPVTESGGDRLDGREVGALAISYATARKDEAMARELARLARERGESAYGDIAEVALKIAATDVTSEEHVARLRRAVQIHPDSFQANLMLARALNATDQPIEARERVDEALRLVPGDLRARLTRLEVLLILEESEEALREARSLLASPLAHDRDVAIYAAAAADSGDLESGIQGLRRALERTPGMPLYCALAETGPGAGLLSPSDRSPLPDYTSARSPSITGQTSTSLSNLCRRSPP